MRIFTQNIRQSFFSLALLILPFTLASGFEIPQNHRIKYNLNYDWKFNKADVTNSQTLSFNDASWSNVSLPHTYNDYDLFDTWVTGSGNYGWDGKTWYRKHFKLDASLVGRRVIVEFEGIRQAGEFYINGTFVGRHEDGVAPCGIDITDYVSFGSTENVLAVKVDNSLNYKELATNTAFVWNTPPFHPNFGGIVSNVNLHVMDKMYQTLPLYANLGTSGTYVYATEINLGARTADITVQSEIKNTYAESLSVDLAIAIVDKNGNVVAKDTLKNNAFAASEMKTISKTLSLTDIKFWSPDYPNIYKVYTQVINNGNVIDVCETPLGVRKVSFTAASGLTINGNFLYLKGYAPRTTMEWVAIGVAPNWLAEYDFSLMKQTNANFIRPMHCGPRKRDVEAADKFGIVYACPAGDAEGDNVGRQWEQRVELMRNLVIYYRNNPSVVFWEGGNQIITAAHMQEMVDIKNTWDSNGGRLSGTRSIDASLDGIAEYGCTMDGVGTSASVPVWDAEYARAESPRRVWDKYSPPSYGYNKIADASNTIVEYPVDGFLYNSSEDLARNNVNKYYERWVKRGGQGLSSVMVGGAKIIFADGVSHGRMANTELCRVAGVTDAARLPKESFYAMKVAQSDSADMEIMGHWTYPAGTIKNVYVMSNMTDVSLATYDELGNLIKDYGKGIQSSQFEFTFANVAWMPGKIVAKGSVGGVVKMTKQISTAGAPNKLKVTPIVGPDGFIADGSDVAMFDVEVVDVNGVRCPTDERTVSFSASGAGVFKGGYNSGIQYSNADVNGLIKTSLNTECGINRVFVRSTLAAGAFTLNATSTGLTSGSATINSQNFPLTNGLTLVQPQNYSVFAQDPPVIPVFSFVGVTNIALSSETISAITTLTGVSSAQAISISATGFTATYSINGGAFTAVAGTINPGDQLRVKIMSAANYLTTRFATVDIGGTKSSFSVTTIKAPDVQVSANLALKKPITASSSEVGHEIVNVNDGDATTRWAGTTNVYPQSFVVDLLSAYKIDSTNFMPYSGRDYQFLLEGSLDGISYFTLADKRNNTVAATVIPTKFSAQIARYVRMTISGAATYTTGWTSIHEFRVYEAAFDIVPDQFTIVDQIDAELFSYGVSEPFIISGIDGPTSISLSDNNEITSYSVNNGPFVTESSQVYNNDIIRVKLGTGSQNSSVYSVKVTIGGVSETFTITTKGLLNAINNVNTNIVLSISPNPTTGKLLITGIGERGTVFLYNSLGQLVQRFIVSAAVENQLDISDVCAGTYIFKYKSVKGDTFNQIIIKN